MRQVLEWTQTMLRVGEAFSGEPCTSLREAVQRQSGRFFQVCLLGWHPNEHVGCIVKVASRFRMERRHTLAYHAADGHELQPLLQPGHEGFASQVVPM